MSVLKDQMNEDVLEQLESLRWMPMRDSTTQARGRARLLALAESLRQGVSPSPVRRLLGWLESVTIQAKERHPMLTTLTTILLALALSFGGAGATAYAAQAALPGDVLYPVKIGLEDAQVALSSNEAAHAQLRVKFTETRMKEMVALIAENRYEDVYAAADRLESDAHQVTEEFGAVAQVDPEYARSLAQSLDTGFARHAQVLTQLMVAFPDEARPAISRALQVCEASRERLRIRQQWRTEQPDDGPLGPPDGVPPGPPDDGPPGPPDAVPPGPPTDVPPGPPDDGPPPGPPDAVPPGPPAHVPPGPPDEVPQGPQDGVPPGTPDEAPQGPGDDALQNPPSEAQQGSAGRNR